MRRKSTVIVPLATALAALAVSSGEAKASTPEQPNVSPESAAPTRIAKANLLITAGEELLGLIVNKAVDGTLVAQHESHSSHASHASHASSAQY